MTKTERTVEEKLQRSQLVVKTLLEERAQLYRDIDEIMEMLCGAVAVVGGELKIPEAVLEKRYSIDDTHDQENKVIILTVKEYE